MKEKNCKSLIQRIRIAMCAVAMGFLLSPWTVSASFAGQGPFLLTMGTQPNQNLMIHSRPLPDRDLSTRGTGTPQNIAPMIQRGVKLWDEAAAGSNVTNGVQPLNLTGNVIVTVTH